MDYKFLYKVLERIVDETIIDYDRKMIETPFPLIGPDSFSRYLFTRSSPIFNGQDGPFISFVKHCTNVYGLNDDEVDYLWVKWRDIIKDKIERNKNTITESEKITVKDSIFLRKIIKYLKDNTKVVIEPFDIYDGYIIAPIGNGFRWDFYNKTIQPVGDFVTEWWEEMLEVYGLSSKAVLIVMGIYQDFISETLEKISDGR